MNNGSLMSTRTFEPAPDRPTVSTPWVPLTAKRQALRCSWAPSVLSERNNCVVTSTHGLVTDSDGWLPVGWISISDHSSRLELV